ncbi:MAG TPA: lysophospholipid acyltransferase family protein [Marinobacter sp.]|nr:lysophospholipid acyltransferase family protein [Marinobacter sp.]
MLYLRTILFNLGYYGSGIIAGCIVGVIWPLFPYHLRWRIISQWNRFVMFWLKLACNIRINIIDQRRGDTSLPAVVMAKHQTTWETLFLQLYMAPIATILKKELMRIPFFGWGLAALKPIAINRSNRMQALRQVKTKGIARLHEGISIMIFPEGTRTPLGQVGSYARGGADIACSAGVAVVPVAHNGAECWPHKHFLKYPGTITIVIGEAIDTTGRDRTDVTEQVKNWIEEQIDAMPVARDDGIYAPGKPHKPRLNNPR